MTRKVVASYCTTFLKPEMLHVYRQVTGLRRYATFVLTKERLNANRFPFAEVEVVRKLPKNFIRRYYLKHVRKEPAIVYRGEFQSLCRAMKRRQADLMHIYFGHTGVHLLPFIEAWENPCVVSFHGMDVMIRSEPRYRERMARMLEAVALVLVRSESLRERVVALGCPPEKVRINRTGIPLDAFPFEQRGVPEGGDWHLVQACRLIPKKGLKIALHAFAAARRDFPRARFTIAGEGPMEGELRALAGGLGLSGAVTFSGFLAQDELDALYRSAHVFVHPSHMTRDKNQEGVPNAMLEAMSTGLPVVATLHGGIPEAVRDGVDGFLVHERDTEALTAALLSLMQDPGRWQAMGRAASESVHANFEQAAQIERLESLYDEAVARGKPAPG